MTDTLAPHVPRRALALALTLVLAVVAAIDAVLLRERPTPAYLSLLLKRRSERAARQVRGVYGRGFLSDR